MSRPKLSLLLAGVALGWVGAEIIQWDGFRPDQSPVAPYTESPGPMQPAAILGDTTDFDYEHNEPTVQPFFFDVAALGDGKLMAATARGLMVFGIADPEMPTAGPYYYGPGLFGEWFHSDKNFFIRSLSSVGDLVAVGAEDQLVATLRKRVAR